ncbi:MAG: hypothetical protein QQW96_04010 [Tychonema bourrellyi B0820]|nr:hypothetical protein [Tychonema bourrellyi B0820]PJE45195.1 MAG: hypothetical protein CUR32_00935 [Flavobacterium sp.] [Flavobacterium sp. FEMGT703F]
MATKSVKFMKEIKRIDSLKSMQKSFKLMQEASKFMSDLYAIDPRISEEIENPSSSGSMDWAISSIIWENALVGNEKALAMVEELFENKDEIQMFLEHSKKEQSNLEQPPKTKTMTISAIAIIGLGLSDKRQMFLELEGR